MKRNGRKSLAGALARAKNESGFTLVELIVVIAILGILAGVGTVGYSGYIKKANMAADEILLDSLNTAFAAACIENGVDAHSLTDNSVSETWSDGKVTAVSVYNDAFVKYFGEGVNSEFKVITDLEFVDGMFVDADGGETYTYSFAGTTVTVSAADKAILSGDNAFTAMTSAKLLNEVGTVETYLSDAVLGTGVLNRIGNSDEFLSVFAGYIGLDPADYEDDDAYWAAYEAKLTELETTNPDAVNNALIMYAASNAANATDTQISNLFTYVENQGLTGRIEGSSDEETMANAALAYGMYTAYAQRNGITTTSVDDFFDCVNNDQEAFTKYVASEEGQADLEAYMAAMSMIGDNTSNTAVTSSILQNGISGNDELYDLMEQIMGS